MMLRSLTRGRCRCARDRHRVGVPSRRGPRPEQAPRERPRRLRRVRAQVLEVPLARPSAHREHHRRRAVGALREPHAPPAGRAGSRTPIRRRSCASSATTPLTCDASRPRRTAARPRLRAGADRARAVSARAAAAADRRRGRDVMRSARVLVVALATLLAALARARDSCERDRAQLRRLRAARLPVRSDRALREGAPEHVRRLHDGVRRQARRRLLGEGLREHEGLLRLPRLRSGHDVLRRPRRRRAELPRRTLQPELRCVQPAPRSGEPSPERQAAPVRHGTDAPHAAVEP